MDFKNKNIVVVGMAKSGIAAALLLAKKGANVILHDAKAKSQLNSEIFKDIDKYEYTDMMGKDITPILPDVDMLVMSPGVPLDLPFILKAKELGIKIIAEIELGYITSEAEFVAITGTNGKTTTTDLTGVIFKNAGKNTFVLGNIGVPITQESLNTKKGDYVVAETAALQLDTIDTYHPRACALLNVTEDHLNRYGTMENYTAAKARVFENQTKDDFCVLNYDNEIARSLAGNVPSKLLFFSRKCEVENGAFVRNGDIIFTLDGNEENIMRADDVKIPGAHNLENALAAICLSKVCGIDNDVIANTLREYNGVEHRIEFVKTVNGIDFINDSKGTNPDATINAILAMKKPTVLMLGGSEKNSDFTEMFESFTPLIKHCVLLGDTAPKIKACADACGYKNYQLADDFKDAVMKAYSLAQEGWAVLLSPACASFDMFDNFEHRGEVFKQIVKELK